jgi:hypothetical protein
MIMDYNYYYCNNNYNSNNHNNLEIPKKTHGIAGISSPN